MLCWWGGLLGLVPVQKNLVVFEYEVCVEMKALAPIRLPTTVFGAACPARARPSPAQQTPRFIFENGS